MRNSGLRVAMGWQGVGAAVMLVAAAGLHLGVVRPMASQVEREALAQQAELAQASAARAGPASGAEKGARLAAELPASRTLQDRTADLLELTQAQGLVPVGDVVISGDERAPGTLARWRVRQEVKGRYTAIRTTLAMALQRDPALSLDSMRLVRDSQDAAEMTAELNWSLHAAPAAEVVP